MNEKKLYQRGMTMVTVTFMLLWLTSVASAMAVVYVTYESRKATQELENLRIEAAGLQIVSGQFLLEKSSWSAYSRVEDIATKELKMVTPDPEKTVLVYRK